MKSAAECARFRTIAIDTSSCYTGVKVVKPAIHKPPAMRREMVWVETTGFLGWGCSQCAWKFNPTGVPAGATIGEMKQHYEQQRDDEFQAHRCADPPIVQAPTPPKKSQPKSKAMKRP